MNVASEMSVPDILGDFSYNCLHYTHIKTKQAKKKINNTKTKKTEKREIF